MAKQKALEKKSKTYGLPLGELALFAPPERIRVEVARVLESYGHGAGHVFNLGHGVLQQTDPEHVRVLVDAVHELSATYHA